MADDRKITDCEIAFHISMVISCFLVIFGMLMFGMIGFTMIFPLDCNNRINNTINTNEVYIVSIDQTNSSKLFQVIFCDDLECNNTEIILDLDNADITKYNLKRIYYDEYKIKLYSIRVELDYVDSKTSLIAVEIRYYFTYLDAFINYYSPVLLLGIGSITGALLAPVIVCLCFILYQIHKVWNEPPELISLDDLDNPDNLNQKAPDQNSQELGFVPNNLLPHQTGTYYPMTPLTNWQSFNRIYFADNTKN